MAPLTWWLSFVDPELPEGRRFLGVAIVRAPNFLAAIREATLADIDPGGDVRGYPLPDWAWAFLSEHRERLLTAPEAHHVNSLAVSEQRRRRG